MDREYKSLLSLLDDENEQAAALAMAELLRRDEKQLEPVLRKLQETTNPRLRKRIHQLQSTILLRRRRRNLTARLFGEKRNLLDGLKNLTVVTNSLMAATLLMESGHHMILTGGEFRAISRTLVGPLTVPVLEKLTIDKAFMGTFGLSATDGITTTDVNEAYTKSQVITRARQVILLADHSKLGHTSFASWGTLRDLDILVTDAATEGMRQQLEEAGVELMLA